MKRKVLFVFSLVAWVLVVCTLLSGKIEEQMTAQVVTVSRNPFGANILPLESLFYDETGYHLFEMVEGIGWESGTRARELGNQRYSIVENEDDENDETQEVSASPSYNGKLIRFSPRPLREGELLKELTEQETMDDVYLAIFPESIPELDSLPNSFKLESRTGTALLISNTKAPQPFMEARARSQLYQVTELRPYIHPMAESETRVYSLLAVEQFMDNVPRLALLLVMLLFPVVLWVGTYVLSRKRSGNKGLICTNLAIAVLDAAYIPQLLDTIDLPSSLLPTDIIFDFGHYVGEFRQVFDTLKTFEGNQLVLTTLQAAENAQHMVAIILLMGILLAILALVVEGIAIRIKRKSHIAFGIF